MALQVKKNSQLTGHSGAVYALCEGVSEEFLFSGSSDKFIAQWNLKSQAADSFAAKLPAIVYALCHIKEHGILLAGTSAGAVHVIDLIKKEEVKFLQVATGPVFDLNYTSDGKHFFAACGDGRLAICALSDFSILKIKQVSNQKVRSIAIDASKQLIALACGDGSIRLLNLHTQQELHQFHAHNLSANVVAFHPNGKHLLSGGRDAHLNIWDIADNFNLVKSIPAHNYAIYSIVFNPEATLFATASRDKTIKLWDANTFELEVRINKEKYDGHINSVNKLYWYKQANQLVSTGDDRALMIWDIEQV